MTEEKSEHEWRAELDGLVTAYLVAKKNDLIAAEMILAMITAGGRYVELLIERMVEAEEMRDVIATELKKAAGELAKIKAADALKEHIDDKIYEDVVKDNINTGLKPRHVKLAGSDSNVTLTEGADGGACDDHCDTEPFNVEPAGCSNDILRVDDETGEITAPSIFGLDNLANLPHFEPIKFGKPLEELAPFIRRVPEEEEE